MRRFQIVTVCLVASLLASAKGILPCMVYRRGLTNEQIDQILAAHPDAQLRMTAQDWRGMKYQLYRFGNMTNYVEQIGGSMTAAGNGERKGEQAEQHGSVKPDLIICQSGYAVFIDEGEEVGDTHNLNKQNNGHRAAHRCDQLSPPRQGLRFPIRRILGRPRKNEIVLRQLWHR